jgi:hypothetical protein
MMLASGLALVLATVVMAEEPDVFEEKCRSTSGNKAHLTIWECRDYFVELEHGYTVISSDEYDEGPRMIVIRGNHVKEITQTANDYLFKFGSFHFTSYYNESEGEDVGWCIYVTWDE